MSSYTNVSCDKLFDIIHDGYKLSKSNTVIGYLCIPLDGIKTVAPSYPYSILSYSISLLIYF